MPDSTSKQLVRRLVRAPWLPGLDPLIREAALVAAAVRRRNPPRSTEATHALYQRGRSRRPILLGHRGAMARAAPENTLGAFRAAMDDGADGVELDVQLTGDAVPIVLHDDTLDRTTTLQGEPLRHAADELDEADAGTWFGSWGREKVPRLAEVFEALPEGSVINVELKGPTPLSLGLERRVLDVIRAHPRIRVIVSSFHPAQLLAVRTLAPEIPIGLLMSGDSLLPLRTAWAAPLAPLLLCDAIHPPSDIVDGGLVGAAHQAGMRVHVWAVKDASDAQRLIQLGVDGLIVDDVAGVAKALRRN
jgi:glycerophosphoryl diester phosphodiesterase